MIIFLEFQICNQNLFGIFSYKVRCAVCKSIFCCFECRNRHEQTAHTPNDVWAERIRLRCGFCQGQPAMEFQCRNDFALIMHLCQAHLPLHCKKCLTVNIGLSLFTYHRSYWVCIAHIHTLCSNQTALILCTIFTFNVTHHVIFVVLFTSNSIRLEIFR